MKQNIFFFRDAALRAYQGVMTLPRFCGDRKHKSDGIRVAKAEPLSASFSTTSARKRDSFASAAFLKDDKKKDGDSGDGPWQDGPRSTVWLAG